MKCSYYKNGWGFIILLPQTSILTATCQTYLQVANAPCLVNNISNLYIQTQLVLAEVVYPTLSKECVAVLSGIVGKPLTFGLEYKAEWRGRD